MIRSVISLSSLDGTTGFRIDGIGFFNLSGRSVASAGDVNGDGIDDLIVAAPYASPNGDTYAGESYVVFGNSTGFTSGLSLSALDGTTGFRIDGIDAFDHSGLSVSSAGDVNGDGIDDVIIGARSADPNGNPAAGESYVVFGNSTGFTSSLSLSALDGTTGFRIDGIDANDASGISVSSAGDVNGDGIDDVIIGAAGGDPNGNSYAGESYVVFGRSTGFTSNLSLSALDGTTGFRIDGIDANDASGRSVSAAGDVNGDGIGDLIIGADNGDPNGNTNAGESYVVFGRSTGFTSSLSLSALDGTTGFRIDGIDANDASGRSVSAAGDVNGDGIDDLIIGADVSDPNGVSNAGESYVVFGRSTGFTSSLSLSALDGTTGFRIDGIDVDDRSGFSVSAAGDVNGDGVDDLIIGAPNGDPNGVGGAGESYVVFGRSAGFASSLSLSALDGTTGFRIDGIDANDVSGFRVAAAGDVNGDGVDDLIVAAPYADPNAVGFAGESYVIFGVNAAPEAADDDVTTDEDTPLSGNVLADNGNGVDRDDSPNNLLTIAAVNGAAVDVGSQIVLASGALLTLNADGSFDYDPNGAFDSLAAGATDTDSFTYAVNDGNIVQSAGVFASSLSLSALDGTTGFRIDGIDVNDRSGYSVSSAGDVNGDGIDDLIVGALYGDPNGNTSAGESYVVFGNSTGFTSSLSLSALDGTTGFRIDGIDAGDYSGSTVSSAGDVNGDGIGDVIIGAKGGHPNGVNNAGESYVVFGRSTGCTSSLSLSALDGTTGFRIDGIDLYDYSGVSVAAAGDVNGDGIDDLIVGAPYADPNGNLLAGESYVVFGSSTGFTSSLSLSALDGTTGFRIDGIDEQDRSGHSVSSAGDVNGDGIDDLIIGARFADPNGNPLAGESYVVFGSSTGFTSSLSLSALDGTTGFRIDGIDANDRSGYSVSSAGDVNGDGIDDLIVGTPSAGPNGDFYAGESYVVFGRSTGFTSSLSLSALDGTTGFRIDGIDGNDQSGRPVASAGDVNGDGIDDLIVGAPSADPNGNSNAGETYVVFGRSTGFTSTLSLSALDGTTGFRIDGIDVSDFSARSLSAAGDVNGDGIDDLIIGAETADPNGISGAGESYVVFGRATFTPVVDVATVTVTVTGVNDAPGGSGVPGLLLADEAVATAVDLSTLTVSDVDNPSSVMLKLTASNGALAATAAGGVTVIGSGTGALTLTGSVVALNAYLQNSGAVLYTGTQGVFGVAAATLALSVDDGDAVVALGTVQVNITDVINTQFGGENDDNLVGDHGADVLIGSGGNDTLTGNAGNDILSGNAGNDSLTGGPGSDIIHGGVGSDTMHGGDNDDTVVMDAGDTQTNLSGGAGRDTLVLENGARFNTNGLSFYGFEVFRGANGNDRVIGNSGAVNYDLDGGGSNDTLTGNAGNDVLTGGAGNDSLTGNAGNDILTGGVGSDTMHGGDNDDTVVMDAGDTQTNLSGGAGRDTLVLENGARFNTNGLSFYGFEVFRGANGNDRVIGNSGAVNYDLDGGGSNDTLTGNAGNDVLTGGAGNDSLTGNAGNDILTGGVGSDTMHGGDNDDTVVMDAGDTQTNLSGGAGRDTLVLENGARFNTNGLSFYGFEVFRGANGNDRVIGNSGAVNYDLDGGGSNDTLTGNAGNDVLTGGAGNDSLTGGAGSDTMHGGDNDDTVVMDAGDTQTNLSGGAGRDTLVLENGARFNTNGLSFYGFEVFRGANGNDRVIGNSGAVNYDLDGGGGNDTLSGNAGNDTLTGGAGNDTLTGGAGSDFFVFASGHGQNVIQDFQDGIDFVLLEGGLAFSDLTLSSIAGGVRAEITAEPGTWLDFSGMLLAQVDSTDFQ